MSTPRKRWFKVADSILREGWDDATLATVMRLMAWLNQRRARDGIDDQGAGEALIGEHDAMVITRCKRPHTACQRLAELPLRAALGSAEASLTQVHSGAAVLFKWDKFANFQSSNTRHPDKNCPDPGSSDLRSPISVSDTVLKKEKISSIRGNSAPSDPEKKVKKASKDGPAPDDLSPEQHAQLREWCQESMPTELPHVRMHIAGCLDHFRANGKHMTDWVATCRNWIRRAPSMRRPGAPMPAAPPRQLTHAEIVEKGKRLTEIERERRANGEY